MANRREHGLVHTLKNTDPDKQRVKILERGLRWREAYRRCGEHNGVIEQISDYEAEEVTVVSGKTLELMAAWEEWQRWQPE